MPHGPQAGIAGQATRLAARAVLLAAVVAAVVTPAVADAASVAYVDNGEVWLASLDGAKKARLATPVVNGDGETENWHRHRAVRRRADRGGPQQAGPDLELLVVQDLGARRDLHRRGTAQRPERLEPVRLSARLRHHRGRVAPRLRVLELELLLPDQLRAEARTSGRRPTARSTRSTPAARRIPRSSARGSSRSRTPRRRRSSTSRTRAAATPTRTPSPRGSTPRRSGSTSKASTSRPTGAWRRSGSRSGTAARRRSARSPSSPSRGSISRPRSLPPWTASCPRPASHGTHRSRRTPARSHGRTTAA